MKYGARNQLKGKVIELEKGAIMAKVKVEIPANSIMCSVMTKESLEDMGIKEGDEVRIVVKGVNVLLVKED